MGKFKTVVIDPPWPLKPLGLLVDRKTVAKIEYNTMSIDDIAAIPIAVCLDEDALVFCWTVNKFLHDTFHIMAGWGIKYSFTMTWVKNGGVCTPVSPQFNSEFVVVGRKGSPKYKEVKAFPTANFWKRGEHSEKPEGFYDLLRRVTPAPRIDIFNRRPIPGFVGWGKESPPDCELPAQYQAILI